MLPDSANASSASGGGKWVTFNDLVDDAMEGGKLEPIASRTKPDPARARRASMTSATIPIVVGSAGSSSGSGGPPRRSGSVMQLMSTSVSSSSESSYNGSGNSTGCSPSPPLPVLPKPPETHAARRKRLTMHQSRSVPAAAAAAAEVTPPACNPTSTTSTYNAFSGTDNYRPFSQSFNDDNNAFPTNQQRPKFSQSFETSVSRKANSGGGNDKYSAFTNLKNGQGYTGWSTQVMGNGPFGWSDELLYGGQGQECSGGGTTAGGSTGSRSPGADNLSEDDTAAGGQLKVTEEPWYKGHKTGTWNNSPSRRFVRNFP